MWLVNCTPLTNASRRREVDVSGSKLQLSGRACLLTAPNTYLQPYHCAITLLHRPIYLPRSYSLQPPPCPPHQSLGCCVKQAAPHLEPSLASTKQADICQSLQTELQHRLHHQDASQSLRLDPQGSCQMLKYPRPPSPSQMHMP